MLLYCKGGVVLAWHGDDQIVDPAAYGSGVSVIPYAGSLTALGKVGPEPAPGEPDGRPYAAPAETAEAVAAYANWKQWALATGGYTATLAGTPRTFKTDPTSLSLMTGKQVRLGQPNPPASINWQFEGAGFVAVVAADFTLAATKVADFVQGTFDTLQAVLTGIAGGSIKTFADVDAAAWPAASG